MGLPIRMKNSKICLAYLAKILIIGEHYFDFLMTEYYSIKLLCLDHFRETKITWVGDQIANYCVNNKLKTTFGKAQETLGAYEKTMRYLANSLGKQVFR